MPPVDYIAPDGQPSGFNVAVIAELGRRLQMNVEFLNTESAARTLALASEEADCVFWVIAPAFGTGADDDWDFPEGMIVSEPYFTWNRWYLVGWKP